MSIVEHPKVSYEDIPSIRKDKYSIIAEMIHMLYNELAEKKCCDNCKYYDKLFYSECYGNCAKHIVNESLGKFIENSDTFYCSYHKFKV